MIHPLAQIQGTSTLWYPELSNIGKCYIGDNCIIHSHVWISDDVKIGNKVRIQAFTFIPKGVIIENDVFIGPRVTFTNDPKISLKRDKWENTIIKKGAKIGAAVVIKAGVVIGEKSLIGMGSVVTKDVPDGETWYGNPARKKD